MQTAARGMGQRYTDRKAAPAAAPHTIEDLPGRVGANSIAIESVAVARTVVPVRQFADRQHAAQLSADQAAASGRKLADCHQNHERPDPRHFAALERKTVRVDHREPPADAGPTEHAAVEAAAACRAAADTDPRKDLAVERADVPAGSAHPAAPTDRLTETYPFFLAPNRPATPHLTMAPRPKLNRGPALST